MAKVIIIERPDGGLTVRYPDPRGRLPDESEADWHARVIARRDKGQVAAIIDHTELPSRRFRDCWRHAGGKVTPDVALARAQLLAEVRRERDARLAASDTDKARLDDIGSQQDRVALARYRQALRDLPAAAQAEVAAIADIAALEVWRPAWPVSEAPLASRTPTG